MELMISGIDIGDYVLATRWPDEDPNDPWAVGFVVGIHADWGVMVSDHNCKPIQGIGLRWFSNARKISADDGKKIVKEWPRLEAADA